jgi:hypothetical protein
VPAAPAYAGGAGRAGTPCKGAAADAAAEAGTLAGIAVVFQTIPRVRTSVCVGYAAGADVRSVAGTPAVAAAVTGPTNAARNWSAVGGRWK